MVDGIDDDDVDMDTNDDCNQYNGGVVNTKMSSNQNTDASKTFRGEGARMLGLWWGDSLRRRMKLRKRIIIP